MGYRAQLADLEARIQALMDEIRALLKSFTAFTESRFGGVEISLFKQLLEYEEKRMSSNQIKVDVQIRKTSSKMHRPSTSGMAKTGGGGGGRSYSYSVADSGISSPVGHNAYGYEEGRTSRFSSVSSAAG